MRALVGERRALDARPPNACGRRLARALMEAHPSRFFESLRRCGALAAGAAGGRCAVRRAAARRASPGARHWRARAAGAIPRRPGTRCRCAMPCSRTISARRAAARAWPRHVAHERAAALPVSAAPAARRLRRSRAAGRRGITRTDRARGDAARDDAARPACWPPMHCAGPSASSSCCALAPPTRRSRPRRRGAGYAPGERLRAALEGRRGVTPAAIAAALPGL